MRFFWLSALAICCAGIPSYAQQCDASLWKHVYHGPNFPTARDRLQTKKASITVKGTIVSAGQEKDGDLHIRLRVDPQFKNLLNAKNNTGEKGFLVVEPMCVKAPTQQDTIDEGVCKAFRQSLF